MADRHKYFHPYHLAPKLDNSPGADIPDARAAQAVDEIYVLQNSTFDFETRPGQNFDTVYPTQPHLSAPHPLPISDIFNEVCLNFYAANRY